MFNTPEKQKYLDELHRFRAVGNLEGVMNVCRNALLSAPGDRTFIRWFSWAQATYVHETLQSKTVAALLEREDFQGLHRLYNKLLDVFPHSRKLNRLLREVEKKLQIQVSQQRSVYFKEAEEKIKALTLKNEWDAALKACEEVLAYDPSYLPFVRLQTKLERSKESYVEGKLSDYFKATLPVLQKQYQQKKEDYIVL